MSVSQAGTFRPTNIDTPILLADYLDAFVQNRYALESGEYHPTLIGVTKAGARINAVEVTRNSRGRIIRRQPVSLLITDYVSSSDPVTIAAAQSIGILDGAGGVRVANVDPQNNLDVSINSSSTGAIVGTTKPTATARGLTVRLVTGESINVNATVALTSGQTIMGAAATQFLNVAIGSNNAIFINLDAVNAVDIGPSTVTVGTGIRLAKAGDPASVQVYRNVNPSAFYGIAVAGAPVVSWAFI